MPKKLKPYTKKMNAKKRKKKAEFAKAFQRTSRKGLQHIKKDAPSFRTQSRTVPLYKLINPGQPKVYDTADALWKKSVEYFEYEDANPWTKVDHKGSEAHEVYTDAPVPYLMEGLCMYLGVSQSYLGQLKTEMYNLNNKYTKKEREEFLVVIEAIHSAIRRQKFHGSANGFFSGTIMSWDLYRKAIAEKQFEVGGQGSGGGLNIIVERDSDRELIEGIKEKLQKIDEEHGDKVNR